MTAEKTLREEIAVKAEAYSRQYCSGHPQGARCYTDGGIQTLRAFMARAKWVVTVDDYAELESLFKEATGEANE